MKSYFFKQCLPIIVLLLSSGDLIAQVNWTKSPGNPVITSGPSGSWYRGIFGPYVLYNTDSLRFEMWFCGSPTVDGDRPSRLGFATSSDGLSWYIHPNPVLTPTPGEWDSYSVEMPIVIRENGLYKMWYYGMASWIFPRIGYATSPDGINWTKYAGNPVLGPGTSSWEAGGALTGSVIPYEGGYKMWYYGGTLNGLYGPLKMGYATSTDGITWQRDTLHNPILSPGAADAWDSYWVCDPRVLLINGIYYMWYTGTNGVMVNFKVGLATSSDGITNWIKHEANPVLRPSQSGWDAGGVEVGNPILIGDTLYLWYPGSKPLPYIYQVGLATSPFQNLWVKESYLDKGYMKINTDSILFRTRFCNPLNHEFIPHLIYINSDSTIIDSLELFDDGLHDDSLANDGLYAVSIPPQTSEDWFSLSVSTQTNETNGYFVTPLRRRFTTSGPVIVDSLYGAFQPAQLRFAFRPYLINPSTKFQILNPSVIITCNDSMVTNITPNKLTAPTILPGQRVACNGATSIYYDPSKVKDSLTFNIHFEIYSDGFAYWNMDTTVSFVLTGIEEEQVLPTSYKLNQNFPNPFNPTTKISYAIPQNSFVELKVFNLLGQEIATLVNQEKSAGNYEVNFDASNLPSGVYIYKMKAGEYVQTRKMILMK